MIINTDSLLAGVAEALEASAEIDAVHWLDVRIADARSLAMNAKSEGGNDVQVHQ